MANPYTPPTLTGYNANPPSDDGTQADQNKVAWSKHTEKLGDPLRDYADAINTETESAFALAVVPTGAISWYAGLADPDGWLICDGRTGLNSVTDPSLVDLFGVIGVQYGGTSASDFALPQVRGKFIRGFDDGAGNDPDAASRTDRGDGTTGDNIGTNQDHAIEDHTHNLQTQTGGTGTSVAFPDDGASQSGPVNPASANVSEETRPLNICFNAIIKK